MVRLASSPTEASGVAVARTPSKPIHFQGLGATFAQWLKRDSAPYAMLAGESAYFDKKVSPSESEVVSHAVPRARAPDEGAKHPTHTPEIDPLELSLSAPCGAVPLPPITPAGGSVPESAPAMRGLVTEAAVIEEVVRRISWGGDRRRGAARIELGGALAGTTIVVQGEGRSVALDIELAPGTDPAGLPARLTARLAARGLEVRSVDVR